MSNLDISETLFLLRDQRRRFVIETLDTVDISTYQPSPIESPQKNSETATPTTSAKRVTSP